MTVVAGSSWRQLCRRRWHQDSAWHGAGQFGRSIRDAGVRPEHFRLDRNGLEAEVLTVEPTGAEAPVVARFAGSEIMGAFRERIATQPGQLLKIRPEGNAVHLFDAETGKRIAA